MKLSPRFAIFFSGSLWLSIGLLLIYKGIKHLFLAKSIHLTEGGGEPLISWINGFAKNPQKSVWLLMCIGLILGFFKGRVMMKRAVIRVVGRICSFTSNIPINALYSKGYLMLIGGMMLMGISFKFLPLSIDIKGFIDFTIGFALINGAMLYFRAGFNSL